VHDPLRVYVGEAHKEVLHDPLHILLLDALGHVKTVKKLTTGQVLND